MSWVLMIFRPSGKCCNYSYNDCRCPAEREGSWDAKLLVELVDSKEHAVDRIVHHTAPQPYGAYAELSKYSVALFTDHRLIEDFTFDGDYGDWVVRTGLTTVDDKLKQTIRDEVHQRVEGVAFTRKKEEAEKRAREEQERIARTRAYEKQVRRETYEKLKAEFEGEES